MRTVFAGDDVPVGVRMPRALHEQLEQLAVEHQSSVSGATRYLLRRGLEQLITSCPSERHRTRPAPRAPETPTQEPVAVGSAQ